jgi:uncharacterized phiE125 gp8 family phage protein
VRGSGPFSSIKIMRQTIQETVTENNIITTLTTSVIESHLRVTYSADQTYLDGLAYAAQEAVENEIGEKFGSISVIGQNSEFTRSFTLPYPANRVGTITVQYYDDKGVLQTIDGANVKKSFSGYPTVIQISNDFKPASLAENNPVVQTFSATVSARSVFPKSLKQAILLMMAHMYENREAVLSGRVVEPPLAFKYLCAQHKRPAVRQPYNPEFVLR